MPRASSALKEMIRVRVDRDRCQGHSRCKALVRRPFHRPHYAADIPAMTDLDPQRSWNQSQAEIAIFGKKATFGRLHSLGTP